MNFQEKRFAALGEILLLFFFVFVINHYIPLPKSGNPYVPKNTELKANAHHCAILSSAEIINKSLKRVCQLTDANLSLKLDVSHRKKNEVNLKKSRLAYQKIKVLLTVKYHKFQKIPDVPLDVA